MDITKSNSKLFATRLINGETVNYSFVFCISSLLFLFLKQLIKLVFNAGASLSVGISFGVCAILLFFLEKRFVFNHKNSKKNIRQALLYIFRTVVDLGFYKIVYFLFGQILDRKIHFVFLITWFIYFFFNFYFDRLLVFDCIEKPENNKNGRLYKLFFRNRYVFASIGLAILGLGFIFMIFSLFPFGDKTVLRMDLYHQYGPLFVEFYDRVTHFKSFIYSWQSGGGSSFLGNYFNYLSSPLSFLIFLFDRKQISYAITILVLAKGTLSAGTFTLYLKHSLKRHSLASASFGVMYAFCAYFLAYYWNIMWIDGMILLPLIALGIERIINSGKPVVYICSLTLLLFSSYYMGYMCCIFSVLYFFVYYFANYSANEKVDNKLVFNKKFSLKSSMNNKFINSGVKFALSSVLCGALCAITLIPVYFILQSCSATSDTFPNTFESYFALFDLLSSHLSALETTIRSSGDDVLPNIYCGILSILLVPLYVANTEIKLKEKVMYILLIIFFVFSFDNNVMNFIWHALHFPNDLPYRFSFMYSFIILILAFKALMHIKAIRYQDIAMVGMIWVLIVLLYQKNMTTKMSELTIYVTLAFVIVWTGVLLMIKKGYANKFILGITIFAITFCEVIVSDSNSYVFTEYQEDYVSNYDSYVEAIDYTYSHDKDFYRTELCYLDTRMDPCLYGYNGMSTFSSMAYEDYSQTQYSLGMFGNRINSYTYNTQTPVYNMMYSVKYLMQNTTSLAPSTDFYTQKYCTKDDSTNVYQNDYYLPIAFETSNNIKDWNVEEGDPFAAQESFIDNATGVKNVFIPCTYGDMATDGADCDEITENGTYCFTNNAGADGSGTIDFTVKASTNSNLYIYITSPTIENVNYYWDDDNETTYQGISEPYIMDLGMHKKGEEVKVSLSLSNIQEDSSYFEVYAYSIDKDVFESAYDLLNTCKLNITKYNSTTIEGTINAGYDGFMYTSIPFDEGWSVYIDGKEVKTFDVGNCQLATTIKQGKHTVKLKYTPRGAKYGILITAGAWLIIITYLIYKKRKSKSNDIQIC